MTGFYLLSFLWVHLRLTQRCPVSVGPSAHLPKKKDNTSLSEPKANSEERRQIIDTLLLKDNTTLSEPKANSEERRQRIDTLLLKNNTSMSEPKVNSEERRERIDTILLNNNTSLSEPKANSEERGQRIDTLLLNHISLVLFGLISSVNICQKEDKRSF